MKRFGLVLVGVFACHAGFGQSFTIDEQRDTLEGTVYVFPVFQSASASKPHEKINRKLQEAQLELIIGEQESSIFEQIWPPNGGVMNLAYEIVTSPPKILCVAFTADYCGAYCETATRYYNFDSATGDFLELDTLFTADGLSQIKKIIADERRKEIRAMIGKATGDGDHDVRRMYEECMSKLDMFFGDFYIGKSTIHFIRWRCSNRAMRELDEIGNFDNPVSFVKLQPHLSEYGKRVLE